MAFIQYLIFNEELLPFPDSYEITLSDVEADSSGETEAGTTQRCDKDRSGRNFGLSQVGKASDRLFEAAKDRGEVLELKEQKCISAIIK